MSESFIYNQDIQQNVRLELELAGTQKLLTVDVLRTPMQHASHFVESALQTGITESHSGKMRLGIEQIPNSAWMKILRMVHRYGDLKSCAPTLDEAVPMFAAIEFLQAKSNTDEGRALKELGDACRAKVRFLSKRKCKKFMALAIQHGVENNLYADRNTVGKPSDYHAPLLAAVRERESKPNASWKESGKYELRAYPPIQVTVFDSHRKLIMTGCGYAMVCASKVWKKASSDINLSPEFPSEVWDKILCVVHRVGMYSPTADDAVKLRDAISSIKPNRNDPAGRNLLSIAEQCQTLLNVKKLVDDFVSAHKKHKVALTEQAAQAALVLSQCDRTAVVVWLQSWMVHSLLKSEPWRNGQASPFELIIDWARCHGPQGTNMRSFLRRKDLIDVEDWSCCPSALREEAIATGVLPEAAALIPGSLRCTNTISTRAESLRICFLDAGQLVTHESGHITRWDSGTGSRIKCFPLKDWAQGRGEYPTHNCILGNNLLASVNSNCFLTSQPTLWNLEHGTLVTRLRPTSEDPKAPKLRAKAYRYIVSGCEEGPGISSFRVGVWGKCKFENDYEYLHNFQPEYRCSAIVGMGNSLFTCGSTRRKDNLDSVTIDERNLDTNTLTRTWTVEIGSSPTNLLVTTKFIALTTKKPEEIRVYDRNVSSNEPVQVLSHERAYHHAVSGQYLVSLADDSFKVWDMCSGDVVQSVHNPESINHWDHGWNSVGFENHTVVVTNRKGYLQFWTSE